MSSRVWWAFLRLWAGLGCLLPHCGPKVLSRKVMTDSITTHLMCAKESPFVEILVTCPWQMRLIQKSYDRQIQYDNNKKKNIYIYIYLLLDRIN